MRAVDGVIRAFIETDPYEIGRNLEADGPDHVYRLTKVTPALDRIGLLIGNCVHCIRSALDHLAYSIADKNVSLLGGTMSGGAFHTIEFSIADTPERYTTKVNKEGMKLLPSSFFHS